MKTTTATQRYLDAAAAVRIVDERGAKNREQAAIAWLHEAGYYSGLTRQEERELNACVREACDVIGSRMNNENQNNTARNAKGKDDDLLPSN